MILDAAIAIKHDSYTDSNSEWKFDGGVYALDTNAPARVHGLFSTGPVVVQGALTAESLKIATLKGVSAESELCANGVDGTVSPCTEINGGQLQASIAVSPTSVIPGTETAVTVSWSATASAATCFAIEGAGFSTGGNIIGTDSVTKVNLSIGDTAQYTILCKDKYGNSALAAAQVVSSEHAPKLAFSVNPGVGGWTNGSFFTTGFSVDANGGGAVSCRKKVDGISVVSTNSWSGQMSGVWSTPSSIPPNTSQSINTCGNGCQFNGILGKPYSSALLTVECTNDHASTTATRWISVGK
jgi:hypothetical protein